MYLTRMDLQNVTIVFNNIFWSKLIQNTPISKTRVVGALRAPPRSLRLPGENTYFLQAQKFKKFKLHIDLKSAGS